jgi:DHA1 family bicyclomycin/chloramphenicol resistance-like MFS transporter
MGLTLGIMSLGINRLLRVLPARAITLTAGATMIVLSAVLLAVIVSTGGRPPFMVWLVLFSLSNLCAVAMFPSIYSLALDPMGDLAGTAASVIGFISAVAGAGLAALTDRSIDDTVLPLAVAYLVYSSISYLFQLAALVGRSGRHGGAEAF